MVSKKYGLELVSKDARGEIYNLMAPSDYHIRVLTIRKGYARGGHSHEYDEVFLLIRGKVEYHTGEVGREKVQRRDQGSTIETVPSEPHYMLALEDCVALEVTPSSNFQSREYPPYRSIVVNLMKKHGR